MKYLSENKKLWWLVFYLYLVPLLGNVLFVFEYERLLGDFSHVLTDPDPVRLLLTMIAYMAPMVLIVKVLQTFSSLDRSFQYRGSPSILFKILLAVTSFTVVFGSIPVGGSAAPGILGLVQVVIHKFNPYLLLILLAGQMLPLWKIVISCLCVLVIGLAQNSLLGYFVLAIAFFFYWVDNRVYSRWHFLLIAVIPLIIAAGFQDVISYLYEVRNQSRGVTVEIPENLMLGYALGRINSFSSLYQILYEDCCGSSPSTFYALGTVIERLIGFDFFSITSPSQTYNVFILGLADYAIFTSTAGATFILFKNGFFITVVNVVVLLAVIKLIYILLPIPSGPRKLPLFLVVLYLPYLSGDAWELSMLLQSIVILRITCWFYWLLGYASRNGNPSMRLGR